MSNKGQYEDLSNLTTILHAECVAPGVNMSIQATSLEHMAEILADTLPDEDPQRVFPVDVEGVGRIGFTCTGTYFDLL